MVSVDVKPHISFLPIGITLVRNATAMARVFIPQMTCVSKPDTVLGTKYTSYKVNWRGERFL